MKFQVFKEKVNVRSKLSQLDKKTGLAGEQMLRAETPREQFEMINAGRKNLIINGDMRIAQRSSSSVNFNAGSTGYKTVDRFEFNMDGSPTATFTVNQRDNIDIDDFQYSASIDCTTANTSGIPADSNIYMSHKIEGQDLQQLSWGKHTAKPLTLSFWVKTTVLGDYVVAIESRSGSVYSRYFTTTYTITEASKWKYVTITIPPNTDLEINNDTDWGLKIDFVVQSGSDHSSGAPSPSRWRNTSGPSGTQLNANQKKAGQTADLGSTTSGNWKITGIQLEVGNVATPFEHRSYGEELALCQRYYWDTKQFNNRYVTAIKHDTSWYCSFTAPVTMRAHPTVTANGGSTNSYRVWDGQSSVAQSTTLSGSAGASGAVLITSTISHGSTGEGGLMTFGDGSNADRAFVALDAEL